MLDKSRDQVSKGGVTVELIVAGKNYRALVFRSEMQFGASRTGDNTFRLQAVKDLIETFALLDAENSIALCGQLHLPRKRTFVVKPSTSK